MDHNDPFFVQIGTPVSAGNGRFWQQNVIATRQNIIHNSVKTWYFEKLKVLENLFSPFVISKQKKINLILGMASVGQVFAWFRILKGQFVKVLEIFFRTTVL